MSTKDVRALIERARHGIISSTEQINAAERQVEAIERAALALDGANIRHAWTGDAWFARGDELAALNAAADVMQSIAKETT